MRTSAIPLRLSPPPRPAPLSSSLPCRRRRCHCCRAVAAVMPSCRRVAAVVVAAALPCRRAASAALVVLVVPFLSFYRIGVKTSKTKFCQFSAQPFRHSLPRFSPNSPGLLPLQSPTNFILARCSRLCCVSLFREPLLCKQSRRDCQFPRKKKLCKGVLFCGGGGILSFVYTGVVGCLLFVPPMKA